MTRAIVLALVLVLSLAASAAGEGARGGWSEPVPPARGGASLPADPVALGQLMTAQTGWVGEEWLCFYEVVEHESAWKVTAWNRQSSASDPLSDPYGAYGLPQSHPPSKLASAGPDWRTSAETQLRWLIGYIKARSWEGVAASLQRTPCGAWEHWKLYLRGLADYSY